MVSTSSVQIVSRWWDTDKLLYYYKIPRRRDLDYSKSQWTFVVPSLKFYDNNGTATPRSGLSQNRALREIRKTPTMDT